MTPAEERIDHEEAKRRLTAWLDDVQLSNRLGSPVYANPSELKADLRALLTEHSAREEQVKFLRERAEGWKLDKRSGHRRACGIWVLQTLARPATEPAQPEEEPEGKYGDFRDDPSQGWLGG